MRPEEVDLNRIKRREKSNTQIDGDKAIGRAYWFHYGNSNPERRADVDTYGHYEDEMVKVDGQWLFSKRVIYNEQVKDWAGKSENPAW